MWFLAWLVPSALILGVFGWSLIILFEQKKSWKSFAKKMNFDYKPGRFSESPLITGKIDGRRVSVFTGAQQTNDIRGQRLVTVIEIEFGEGLSAAAAIATKEFSGFMSTIVLEYEYEPDFKGWDKSYIIRTRDKEALGAYLNTERLKILQTIFSMKNASALFFFDHIEAILRIETSDPLRDSGRMEKIIRQIVRAAAILAPDKSEKKIVKKDKEPATDESVEENRAAEIQDKTA